MKSESINELATALAKAQGEMGGAAKTSENPFYKSKYADLAAVWDAIRIPFSKNGLAVVQTSGTVEGIFYLHTTLMHSSGQWIDSLYPIEPVKKDPQGLGSAISYARRYSLMAIAGVAPEEDDGNLASAKHRVDISSASQPGPDDGVIPTAYRIGFGQWKSKSVEQVAEEFGLDAIKKYILFLEESAIKKKESLKPAAVEFIEQASSYIAAFENSDLPF